MSVPHYDFSGWATRNNVLCADGRTILKDAFKDNDGQTVPLVWHHQHNDPENVLGHALLENRDEGVYCYCTFNDSPKAQTAKELVNHGDVRSLSIYANKLKQQSKRVMHGIIREVSLVLAGANPEALIDVPVLSHGDNGEEIEGDEAFMYLQGAIFPAVQPMPVMAPPVYLAHADNIPAQTVKEEQPMPTQEKTVRDVFNELTEEQQNVVYYIIGEMLENAGGSEDESMSHSLFDNDNRQNTLTHADEAAIIANAKRTGSMKDAFMSYIEDAGLAHAVYNSDGSVQGYGVADIETLFPEYRNLNNPPDWIRRDQDWVSVVMNGVHTTPFSRIKSQFANITMDEARAKGYVKGNRKIEEVFSLLRRTTDPQTVYKKQKLDRDDVIDITDFDIVAWIKEEMKVMLHEEIARAILIGDGRLATDEDHISEAHIRPIWGDDDLYAIKANVATGKDDAETAKNLIRTAIKARKDYKGSGNLVFFTTEDWLTEMLLLEDGIGHTLYADEAALARKMRCSKIVTVPVMENQVKDGETLVGIMVDLKDYNVGADKGGNEQLFEDFDIDYNQQKYLIETRKSGALTKPFSAIVLVKNGHTVTYTEATPEGTENPKTTGWYEKQGMLYRPTTDTTVVEGKTYYVKTQA